MIYDHKKLTDKEMVSFIALVKHYHGYDKLDIIIELAVDDPTAIIKRENNKKNKKIKTQAIPDELKFCDGDSCSVDFTYPSESKSTKRENTQ